MALRKFSQAGENAYRELCANSGIPYTPRPTLDDREGRREARRQDRVRTIRDGMRIVAQTAGVRPECIARLCTQAVTEDLRTIEQQRALVELAVEREPWLLTPPPPPAPLPPPKTPQEHQERLRQARIQALEVQAARVQRMNTVSPEAYAAWRREHGLPVHAQHLRPVPLPSIAQPSSTPSPEPPPISASDQAYNAARARIGLPPCSKSSSEHWAAKTGSR